MRTRISILTADITTLDVDAIVNAANARLIPGGGVDGAINKAAGPELGKAMMSIGRCATGEAVITPGIKLLAKHVIHTVAPIFSQHKQPDVWRLLANCYRNSLALAASHGAQTIAFPSLGTGAYGIPIKRASEVAIATARAVEPASVTEIMFCCFSAEDADTYRDALDRCTTT